MREPISSIYGSRSQIGIFSRLERSEPFLETQRKLLRASSDLRIAQQDVGDFYNELLGMPTRSEIDDLSKTLTELKREVRAARQGRRAARQ